MGKGLKMLQQCRSQEEALFADSGWMRNRKPVSFLVNVWWIWVLLELRHPCQSSSLPRRDVMGFPALPKEKPLMIRSRHNILAGRDAFLIRRNWMKCFSNYISSGTLHSDTKCGESNCCEPHSSFLLWAFPSERRSSRSDDCLAEETLGGWGW